MGMNGWISLYRQTLENPIVCKDSDYIAVWLFILLSATHEEIKAEFSGKSVRLSPGQIITGRKEIAQKFRIHESKVQRILRRYETEQQIEQQTTGQGRLITVLNWHKYQQSGQQSEQQVNNKRTTSEQQVNTNNNVITKQSNNIPPISPKGESVVKYPALFEKFWEAYPKKKGKGQALKVWKRLKLSQAQVNEIITHLNHRKNRDAQWIKDNGRFIPHPSTWLNAAGWEDEYEEALTDNSGPFDEYLQFDDHEELFVK